MKPTIKAILKGAALGLAAVAIAIACSSCVSTVTTTTLPDGTVVKIESKGPDAASVNAAANLGGVVGGLVMQKIIAEK